MELRQAILQAADWIESHPDTFKFFNNDIPDSCGTPGCALGHIAFFMGHRGDVHGFSERVFGIHALEFLDRVSVIAISIPSWKSPEWNWHDSPRTAANCLRLYADKYHPAANPSFKSGAQICEAIMAKPLEREHA